MAKAKLTQEARAFFVECGKRGGNATKKKYGKEHYKKIRREQVKKEL